MTDDAITIAPAGPGDLETVRGLMRAYQAWLGLSLDFQDFAGELAALPGDYVAPDGALLLARDVAGTALGLVALRPLGDGICEMKRLFVPDAARGRGIGRRLAEAVIAAARAAGHRRMRLDSMAGRMPRALSLYRSLGFREIPPYTHNPEPDAVYLERDLTR